MLDTVWHLITIRRLSDLMENRKESELEYGSRPKAWAKRLQIKVMHVCVCLLEFDHVALVW